MTDPVTTNKGYAVPANNADIGSWDVPVNGNFQIMDKNLGGVLSLSLGNVTPVTLTASQAQNAIIVLTGSLSTNLEILLPDNVGAIYTIDDQTVNNGHVVGIRTSTVDGVIVPWGHIFDIYTDGSVTRWRNPPVPGSYLYFPNSSAPAWATSTYPRAHYLPCDGFGYNTTLYARLNRVIGATFGSNVPDLRGRGFWNVDAGTGRIGSIIGSTIGSVGGNETITLSTAQIPAHNHAATVTDPGHPHTFHYQFLAAYNSGASGAVNSIQGTSTNAVSTDSAKTNISVSNANTGSGNSHSNMPPALVGGITLIKT